MHRAPLRSSINPFEQLDWHTPALANAWLAFELTIDQVFVDFALEDQYTAASQSVIQQFLTPLMDVAGQMDEMGGVPSCVPARWVGTHACAIFPAPGKRDAKTLLVGVSRKWE